MQKIILSFLAMLMLVSPVFASADIPPFPPQQPPLNQISYQLTQEKWATTDTVKVTISMDAVLDKVGLSNVNSHVLENLTKMAKVDWHVTEFTRSQDKSGLEMLHVEAEARLPQNSMASLRDKAKDVSRPGETYTVSNIDFSPSMAEVEKTHADARMDIYQRVKEEITRLNQTYPEQQYFLHSIDFVVQPQGPVMYKGMAMATAAPVPHIEASPNIPVNAKVTEVAQVVIAAKVPAVSAK